MKAETLFAEMAERYRAAPDRPFSRFPEYAVFRHGGSRKWFGVYLPVPAEKLGRAPGRTVPLLNVKCRPEHIGAMRADALIRQLIDDSFRLTQGKAKIRKQAT